MPKRPASDLELGFVETQAALAAMLGISPRLVREWVTDGLACKVDGFGYSVPVAIEWAKANRWQAQRSKTRLGGDELNDPEGRKEAAELRKLEADAAIKEAKAEQLLGQLVDRDVVNSEIRILLNSIRGRLQAVPEEVAGVIPEQFRADIQLDMSDKVELILTEISAWLGSTERYGGPATEDDQEPEEMEVPDLED